MNVKELIEELRKLDPQRIVLMAIDEEGNGFSPITEIDDNKMWNPEDGEVALQRLTPELMNQGFGEEDLYYEAPGVVPAVVLWP